MMTKDKVQIKELHVIDTFANMSITDEAIECLNSLAIQANQSAASALKVQIQVVK